MNSAWVLALTDLDLDHNYNKNSEKEEKPDSKMWINVYFVERGYRLFSALL